MSLFEDSHYQWRETYFVLFDAKKRPSLERIEKVLSGLNQHYELVNADGDSHGRFESLTLLAPDDFAALDICYVEGDEVREQVTQLVAELKINLLEPDDQAKLKRVSHYQGRFDVLHFEQITEADEDEDEAEELLDPTAVLLVLGALAKLTDGVAIDPQSGTLM